jgi:hypothetical protein
MLPSQTSLTMLPSQTSLTMLPSQASSTMLPSQTSLTMLPNQAPSTMLPSQTSSTMLPNQASLTMLPSQASLTMLLSPQCYLAGDLLIKLPSYHFSVVLPARVGPGGLCQQCWPSHHKITQVILPGPAVLSLQVLQQDLPTTCLHPARTSFMSESQQASAFPALPGNLDI